MTSVLVALVAGGLYQNVKANSGEAHVFILTLPNIGGSWVDSCDQVKEGAVEACMLKGEYMDQSVPRAHPTQDDVDYPPYYAATPTVIATWGGYRSLIVDSWNAGIIIVNTHGQILPVPNGYSKEVWLDKISEVMLTRRVSWVHVAMYPFYIVKYENGTSETWGDSGFRRFMSYINKNNVDCWLPMNATSTETTRIERARAVGCGVDWELGLRRAGSPSY